MAKNSFLLLEAIVALIILLILVSGFSKLTYFTFSISLEPIKKALDQSNHMNIQTQWYDYTVNNEQFIFTHGSTISHQIYNDSAVQLEYFKIHIPTQSSQLQFERFE